MTAPEAGPEGADACKARDQVMSRLNAALDAGASAMFTHSGTECVVTITYGERTFTGHAGNAVTALGIALAAGAGRMS